MSITYQFKALGERLHVTASGFDDSADEVMAYGMAIVQAAREAGSRQVLCDERSLEYRLNMLDTFAAGEFISAQAPRVARIAIVCQSAGLNAAKFYETVTTNRGLRLRVFTQVDEADSWLRSDPTATIG